MKNETSGKQGKPLSEKDLEKVTGGEYDFVYMEGDIPLITSDGVWIRSTLYGVYKNDDNARYTLSYISNSEDRLTSTYFFRNDKNYQEVLVISVTQGNNKTELIRYVQ